MSNKFELMSLEDIALVEENYQADAEDTYLNRVFETAREAHKMADLWHEYETLFNAAHDKWVGLNEIAEELRDANALLTEENQKLLAVLDQKLGEKDFELSKVNAELTTLKLAQEQKYPLLTERIKELENELLCWKTGA